MNRRKVLSWLTLSWVSGSLSVVIGACSNQSISQTVQSSKIETTHNGFLKVGTVQDLDKKGRLIQSIEGGKKVLIVRDEQNPDTLHALNPICTHQGCPVDWEQGSQNIFCACHGSTYKTDGTVLNGPASRSLETFAVKVDKDSILVNPNAI